MPDSNTLQDSHTPILGSGMAFNDERNESIHSEGVYDPVPLQDGTELEFLDDR